MDTLHKDYSQLDAGLRYLHDYGPELSNGFTNHGPMVSEALSAMGRSDAVMPWIEKNWHLRGFLMPHPNARRAIVEWRNALGNNDAAAWSEFFVNELSTTGWRDFVARWAERLAPAIGCAAAHGAIRAGHAVRGIAERETPERLRELTDAFGYWAARYETLPVADYRGEPVDARAAIMLVPFSPGSARQTRGGFSDGLRSLRDFPDFEPVTGMLDVSGDPAKILSELTETFARVYLANAHDAYTVIAFIHSVTAIAALRSMAPYLDAEVTRTALRYGWQAAAALYCVYGTTKPDGRDADEPEETPYRLVALAVDSADDHAIKFTETCLREYALNPNPVYLAAAHHAIGVLGEHG